MSIYNVCIECKIDRDRDVRLKAKQIERFGYVKKHSGRSHSYLDKVHCTFSVNLNMLISKYANLVLRLT